MSARFETLLSAMLNGEQVDIEPRSRMEQFLKNCCDKCGCEGLPTPRSRAEILLYQLAEQLAGGGSSSGGGENKFAQLIDRSIEGEITEADLQGVTKIGDGAFLSCAGLTSVTIPNSITKIGERTFSNCTQLTNIHFENNSILTTIGSYAFTGVPFEHIELPSSVGSLGNAAFSGCSQLKTMILHSENPPSIQTYTFSGVPNTCVFKVPAASVEAYKAATNWSKYASQIVALEE